MVIVEYQYHSELSCLGGCDAESEAATLPINIGTDYVLLQASDVCETIVTPALGANDLMVLRRALNEWGLQEWLDLEEQVEVNG